MNNQVIGNPVVLTEACTGCDFNDDGVLDGTTQYHVGNLEIYYPPVTATDPATGASFTMPGSTVNVTGKNMILSPASGKEGVAGSIPPIFTLVKVQKDGSLSRGDTGDYDAIRMQLTMFNFYDTDLFHGGNPGSDSIGRSKYRINWSPLTTRRYESLISLRSLAY